MYFDGLRWFSFDLGEDERSGLAGRWWSIACGVWGRVRWEDIVKGVG